MKTNVLRRFRRQI